MERRSEGPAPAARFASGPPPAAGLRLGLDTGGTCTDAALVNAGGRVVGSAKAATTHGHLLGGLRRAALAALADAGARGVDVTLVSLSTTLATNALVEGRGRPAGLVLVGARPAALSGGALAQALGSDPGVRIAGGHDAMGEPVCPLDLTALGEFARAHAAGVEAWAVSAVFAGRNPAHEIAAATLLRDATGHPVSCGHELASALDAPRRALTALLNARLLPAIAALIDAAQALLAELGIDAPLMVVRGDGSPIAATLARERPVETILSGPAASVVGACALAGVDEALIVDTGGTTTDVVRVSAGRPRLSAGGATVGGHRTMVRAIEMSSVGLGGDSEVRLDVADSLGGRVALGPARVIPLCSLVGPDVPEAVRAAVLGTLRRQLERDRPHRGDGRFAVRLPGTAPAALAPAAREWLDRLGDVPVAFDALARLMGASGVPERPLGRLEARGLVLRAGFTPTDAARLIGQASTGGRGDDQAGDQGGDQAGHEAARLGAALFSREAAAASGKLARGGGDDASAALALADQVMREMALRVAHACASVALGDGGATRRARLDWVGELLAARAARDPSAADRAAAGALEVSVRLDVPIVGVGGAAHRHHPAAARLLGTRCVLPEHAGVANAVGAVAGLVREARTVTLLPDGAGAGPVRVLLATGPRRVAELEAGVALATDEVRADACAAALGAGAHEPVVDVRREDDIVHVDGLPVLVECRVTATATGRPRQAHPHGGDEGAGRAW